MVKKKTKAGKKLKRKGSWLADDVQASCSLPPMVDGQVRCYLRLCISQIVWTTPAPPAVTAVRVRWWGESGPGTLFRPLDVKKGNKSDTRTVARYAVRSGPKQLAAYLTDMSNLILEIISASENITVGKSQVDHIAALAPGKPINGFFPVFSADNEKVAELQVSVVLESLMESFESSSTVATPDMSMDVRSSIMSDPQPVNPPRVVPTPQPYLLYSSTDDPFNSPMANRSRPSKRDPGVPVGVDSQIYGTRKQQKASSKRKSSQSPGRKGSPKRHSSPRSPSSKHSTPHKNAQHSPKSNPSPARNALFQNSQPSNVSTGQVSSGDLVSELLVRGNRLREAMIVSTLDDVNSKPNPDVNVPAVSFIPQTPSRLKRADSTGNLFKELLQDTRTSYDSILRQSSQFSDLDEKAIDLVLGSDNLDAAEWRKLKAFQGGSPNSSLSDLNEDLSELEDPLHDQHIIEELFYKNPDSESDVSVSDTELPSVRRSVSSTSLEDPGNRRPPSRHSSTSSVGQDEPVRDTDVPIKSRKKRKPGRRRVSESEVLNSSRNSETSKVSFDPTPSDAEETSAADKSGKEEAIDGLSVERLTLLGRVHMARVLIDSLKLEDLLQESFSSKNKSLNRGKPPRPVKKVNTFFVEYQFPVVATSRDKYTPNAMATEVVRVASKKIADNSVNFNHRSVFPVMFDGESIGKWWKSALVFKVYSKTASQKVPTMLGMCSLPLKKLLKSEALYMSSELEVKDRSASSRSSFFSSSSYPLVGTLKVVLELGSDNKDFATALARTRLAEMTNHKVVPIPQSRPSNLPPSPKKNKTKSPGKKLTTETQTEPQRRNIEEVPYDIPADTGGRPVLKSSQPTMTHAPVTQHTDPYVPMDGTAESMTLHTLLHIPEGQNITLHGVQPVRNKSNTSPSVPPKPTTGWKGRDMNTRNLYLVARMFWCDDFARSNVCWGTFEPDFNFTQIAPVLLTQSLLERMRNNVMVVEVWDKKTTADSDQLVGMVKLPLHQFYMSFRDRKIANALLKSQYPVVTVDSCLPIVNPFSGAEFGKLKVLLAMGSTQQVSALQRFKASGDTAVAVPERPQHFLERQEVYADGRQLHNPPENMIEHIFEVSVESIRGLRLLEDMIWGEADCFIQYHFPTQSHSKQQPGPDILHATPTLKSYRTATTLCVPDPTFNDVIRHRLLLPEGTPVQREILTACSGAGGGSGGVPFEIWCRYYHPNVRDQVIAKCTLPLAKLCAMVTMQRRGEPSVQTFSLPLAPISPASAPPDDANNSQIHEPGLLEVTVNYKSHVVKSEKGVHPEVVTRSLPSATVCLSVGVLRASGLKAAAATLAHLDAGMQYASEVGVNSYVRVQLSFLQKEDERLTRTVARSFAPEYSYHMDFPVPLLWTEPDSDALSLAEILETSEATFELWHQTSHSYETTGQQIYTGTGEVTGRRLVSQGGDILLGTTTLPLKHLLTHKTGVSGWYGVNAASAGWQDTALDDSTTHSNQGLERVVGGLDLSVKFAHHEDLDRVLHAARAVGWAPDFDLEHRDWESADESGGRHHKVTIDVDTVVFPASNALIAGQSKLDPNTHVYVRYKLYDKKAICSKLCRAYVNDAGYIDSQLNHNREFHIPASSPFSWYLHEERLELQVWVTFHTQDKDKKRPAHRDKLIGSAYLMLHSLADPSRRQHRISGVYPLFKPGAASLGGACLRAHVTMKHDLAAYHSSSEDSDVELATSGHGRDARSGPAGRIVNTSLLRDTNTVDMENTFMVHISIERAYHLPHIPDASGNKSAPNSYVSYQTAEKEELACTDIFPSNNNPVWAHDHETHLSKGIFQNTNKTLIFKVWHKVGDPSQQPDKSVDRVLGFVAVDLAPLVSGFQQVSGWYNIMNFNGMCQGQIKVAITPKDPLIGLKETSDIPSTQEVPERGGSFLATGLYTTFPSHISHHTEQQIVHDPNGPGPILQRFAEHYENVKRFHEHLHRAAEAEVMPAPHAASSASFSNLRSNLAELDEITHRLRQRLMYTEPSPLPSSRDQTGSTMYNLTEPSPASSSRDHSAPLSSTTQNIPVSSANAFYLSNITFDAQLQGTSSTVGESGGSHHDAPQSSSLSATTTFLAMHDGQSSEQPDTSHGQSPESHLPRHPGPQPGLPGQFSTGSYPALSALTNTLSSTGSGLRGTFTLEGSDSQSDTPRDHPYGSRVTFKENIAESIGSRSLNDANDLTSVTPLSLPQSQTWEENTQESDEQYQEYQNTLRSQSDQEDLELEAAEIIPRPLNDVSSALFSNFLQTQRHPLSEVNTEQLTKFSEEDSWFSTTQLHDPYQPLVDSIAGLEDSTQGQLPVAATGRPWVVPDVVNTSHDSDTSFDRAVQENIEHLQAPLSPVGSSNGALHPAKSRKATRYRREVERQKHNSSSEEENMPLPGRDFQHSDDEDNQSRHSHRRGRYGMRYRRAGDRNDSVNTSETGETQGFEANSEDAFMHEVIAGHDFSNTYKMHAVAEAAQQQEEEVEYSDDWEADDDESARGKDQQASQVADTEEPASSRSDKSTKSEASEVSTSSAQSKDNHSANTSQKSRIQKSDTSIISESHIVSHKSDGNASRRSDNDIQSTVNQESEHSQLSNRKSVHSEQQSHKISDGEKSGPQMDHKAVETTDTVDNRNNANNMKGQTSRGLSSASTSTHRHEPAAGPSGNVDEPSNQPSQHHPAELRLDSSSKNPSHPVKSSSLSSTLPPAVGPATWRNFFPGAKEMEISLRSMTLTPVVHSAQGEGRVEAAQDLVKMFSKGRNFSTMSAKTLPKPSAEQSQRIAKIFSARFTST